MPAYYNENDAYAAQWLRNLIAAGHITSGDVDERSIVDVRADDIRGYGQCHWFAGIGGWSLALRLAGVDDARSIWTGSCPCQPFSAAGAGKAADDERHLWPRWFPLIAECRPAIVFGEQVEAAIGWGWLDVVFADLEAEGYACGATVLPACGVGAPHIRQRAWFVGVADRPGLQSGHEASAANGHGRSAVAAGRARKLADAECAGWPEGRLLTGSGSPASRSGTGELGDAGGAGLQERERDGRVQREAMGSLAGQAAVGRSDAGGVVDSESEQVGFPGRTRQSGDAPGELGHTTGDEQRQSRLTEEGERWTGAPGRSSAWRDLDWLSCTDGKARPVEPGTFPLAHGIPGRVGRLRAYGNAITPQVAAQFIAACRSVEP